MLRSVHFRVGAIVVLLPLMAALAAPQKLVREGTRWRHDFYGSAGAVHRLRINAHGPVTLQAGSGDRLTYRIGISVSARTEAEAQRVLDHYKISLVDNRSGWSVLTAPGGPVVSTVTVTAPRLEAAAISTSAGAVEVTGVDGPLEIDTGAGELSLDRIKGDCKVFTGGGDVHVGTVRGSLFCRSGAGRIQVGSVSGEAVLETVGGDIVANDVAGMVRAETGGGTVHILKAGGSVNAGTGGGPIIVDRAGGLVTVRNMAGPVQVGAAGGVQCESASGGIRVSNISGSMHVSTSLGNILASLVGGRLSDAYLATGNGDIIVVIPSNVGVNIRAQNDLADSLRRIISDFSGIQPRRQGRLIVAEGPVNGGGPLLQISATVGTIFIKRQ